MKRVMALMVVAVVGLLGSAGAATAQTTAPALPKVELSAGYQFQSFDGDENWGLGWYADIAVNLNRAVGIVGLVNGSYRSESTGASGGAVDISARAHTFMGGVRFSTRQAKNTLFVQALAGAMRLGADVRVAGALVPSGSGSDSIKAALVGVGFNALLSRNISFRVAGDYVRVFPDGDNGHTLRATAGLVFAFGSR